MNKAHSIKSAHDFALACDDEIPHSAQVTRLALLLFDELQELHSLDGDARCFLELGAMLHDIGFCESAKGHHKHSLRLILEARELPFDKRERFIIASIARYHRKALPKKKHAHFEVLNRKDKRIVRICAAILRIADSMDISHTGNVNNAEVEITGKSVIIRLEMKENDPWIETQILKKKTCFCPYSGKM